MTCVVNWVYAFSLVGLLQFYTKWSVGKKPRGKVHGLSWHCPWTMFMDSLDIVHGLTGHCPIFTLANNFLRWTYLGPRRFIHTWMTLFHVMLRVSDVIDKCKWWLADVMFDWRHVMVTAVERNNQTRRIKTFLCHLFARFKSIFHK